MINFRTLCQAGMLAGLAAVALSELSCYARRREAERKETKQQLLAWEDEGGALPTHNQVPHRSPTSN